MAENIILTAPDGSVSVPSLPPAVSPGNTLRPRAAQKTRSDPFLELTDSTIAQSMSTPVRSLETEDGGDESLLQRVSTVSSSCLTLHSC
jgi:hypothetical protein